MNDWGPRAFITAVLLLLILVSGGAIHDCVTTPSSPEVSTASDVVICCNYALYGCMDKFEDDSQEVKDKFYQKCIDMYKYCVFCATKLEEKLNEKEK